MNYSRTPDNDLISRSALLERMEKVLFATVPVEHQLYVQMAIDAFKAVAENAPAVDAEPVRHGRWIPVGDDDQYAGTFRCSECTDKRYFGEGVYTGEEASMYCPYCPNCGMKADGDSDG